MDDGGRMMTDSGRMMADSEAVKRTPAE